MAQPVPPRPVPVAPANPLAIEDVRVTLDAIDVTVATPEGKVLLDRVTFSLPPSSVLAVVGPSGAGKSTLTNALNGFAPATSGQVLFDGHDLYASYDVLRRRIGYVPQQDILHPQLSVRRALEYAAELRFPPQVGKADKRARIEEVLDELDLVDRAGLRIERLSGGQRKRVSVALELLTKPSLLFLDEPTSGLDPGNERQVMALLRDLANAGRTIIVVTHSTQSLHLCDRVMFLAPGGKVSYFGPPVEALTYFKRHDAGDFYADVFTSLEERPGVDWAALFRSDPDYQRFVAEPLTTEAAARPAQQQRALPPAPQQSWLKQFSVLTRRYVALIASDRRYSLLLLLQAPILGAVLFLLFGPRRLSVTHGPEATVLILALVIGATWLGMLNAIREIVKELPIYQRERSVGLSITAYLASKAAVLSVFTIFQAIVVVGIGLARQKVFEYDPRSGAQLAQATGSFLHSPKPELIIDIALTGLAAMALGLMVSAFAKTADKALTLVPILIVPQLVLSGGFFPIQAPVLKQLSYVSSAQWGVDATASTIDLNVVRGRLVAVGILAGNFDLFLRDPQAFSKKFDDAFAQAQVKLWEHKKGAWELDAFALLALAAIELYAAWFILRRRDRRVLPSGARGGKRPASGGTPGGGPSGLGQPVQRDGRWYVTRGGQEMVWDDTSKQWIPPRPMPAPIQPGR